MLPAAGEQPSAVRAFPVSSRSRKGVPQRELEQAAELYRDFRERGVGQLKRRQIDWPRVTVQVGRVLAIEYSTSHGPKPERYRHDFAAWARPEFDVSADGRLLLCMPGNYVFTERGIVDTRQPGRRRSRP
jgi:hypothetical protein